MPSSRSRSSDLPAILAISSHVARGSVGNRAIVPALQVLGHKVWAVPTVLLPWHPGHGPGQRIPIGDDEFAALLGDLASTQWAGEIGAVISGYMASAGQAGAVGQLVDALKSRNGDLLFCCDPVIGDGSDLENGRLYVDEAVAHVVREDLLPRADVVTPNRFELCWLAGQDTVADDREFAKAAATLGAKLTVATSMPGRDGDHIANYLLGRGAAVCAEHELVRDAPNGSGDLLCALLTSRLVSGCDPADALQLASSCVAEIVAHAVDAGAGELLLEDSFDAIVNPTAPVAMRPLRP